MVEVTPLQELIIAGIFTALMAAGVAANFIAWRPRRRNDSDERQQP